MPSCAWLVMPIRCKRTRIAGADRFNRLHPSLGQQLPAELVGVLSGPSTVQAYVAARVLDALDTSQAAQVMPGLWGQIMDALVAAIQDPGSRREVWIMKDEEITQKDTLDQHLSRALLRVAGF